MITEIMIKELKILEAASPKPNMLQWAPLRFSEIYHFEKISLLKAILSLLLIGGGESVHLTCHMIKQLIRLQVGESAEADGASEGGSVGGISLICLNPPPHVIELVLHHIDQ